MKININSSVLRDGLNKVLTVIDKKNARPILTNCLINAENGRLELIATDLEVTAKVILDSKISEDGSFCINTKNFHEILKELPNADVEMDINQENNILELSCEKINYSLLITNSDEYPQVNFENSGKPFQLKSRDFSNIIAKTSHAISNDETRINLNGIYAQQIDGKLRTVAIDGHRLALLDVHDFQSDNQSLMDGVIIPRKGISEIKKIADAFAESTLTVSLDESFLYLSANDEYFLSVRLIAREYPKYQTVIPSKTSYSMIVDKNALLNAVKRIKILSNEKTNGIKVGVSNGLLTVSANHPSLGHAKETVPVEYEGEEMEIGFNAKYMIESLMVLDVDEVIYEFNNELSPVVVRSDAEPDFLGIIMPLKL
ncbi:MAG: DNA polymerase III subunit beta [Halobacteriovoraceae bacterium]|nr:DNA polymerase III subunit beta [Halobacteriovoraceae bacterium]|tara:strand:+ start:5677 stop:6792 length:1116 start_codon:yes stop_codon:yes gene_type:complete